MRKAIAVCVTLVAVAAGSPTLAFADQVQIGLRFTAGYQFGPLEELYGTPLPRGTEFTGRFTYDPAAADQRPGDPRHARYVTGFLSIDTPASLATSLELDVWQSDTCRVPAACTNIDAFGFPDVPGFYERSGLFWLIFRASPWNSKALPQTAEEFVAAFPNGRFLFAANKIGGVTGYDTLSHELGGTLVTEPVVTPEPGTMLLLTTGLVGLFARRYRRTDGAGSRTLRR